jgi:hypothetical protein
MRMAGMSGRQTMTDEKRKQEIIQRHDRLHETFDYNGVLGGKTLALTMELERTVGQLFVRFVAK